MRALLASVAVLCLLLSSAVTAAEDKKVGLLLDINMHKGVIKGAFILSLTDRFAGCRGPVLVAMRSPKSGFSGHGPLCYVRTD